MDAPAVAVQGGVVVGVGKRALEMGFKRLELEGLWLAPGAVDAHVHLHLGGGKQKALSASSAWGLVAVRDMGHGPLKPLPANPSPPPAVVCCGPGIYQASGARSWMAEPVGSEDAARQAVRARARAGAGFIKVFSTGLLDFASPGTVDHAQGMDEQLLGAVVEEAAAASMKVAVHASGSKAVQAAIRAGVWSVEHGFFLDETTFELMAARGVWWVPTIVAVQAHATDPAGRHPQEVRAGAAEIVRIQQQALVVARNKGVALAMGTDAGSYGVGHGEGLAQEMRLWLEAGIDPHEVFRAATAGAAAAAGMEGIVGTITEGAQAWIVGVTADPRKEPLGLVKPRWRSWK